jgi:hypothetical protein
MYFEVIIPFSGMLLMMCNFFLPVVKLYFGFNINFMLIIPSDFVIFQEVEQIIMYDVKIKLPLIEFIYCLKMDSRKIRLICHNENFVYINLNT